MIADATHTPTAASETSLDLLREFERTGDSAAFELFMRRHAAMVYATCLKVTRDPHDAEDATQATFLTLASKSRLNGEIRQPEAWLRKVAHRLSLDLIRSRKRRVNRENLRSEMTSEAAPLDSHDHADNGEMKSILNEELAKLPASYRMPLILHYFGGLSREEMAEQLKLKPSTLGVRLHRAREQLRKRLASRGVALPAVAVGALLADAVRSAVSSHMVTATAHQASAIAFGHAMPVATAHAFSVGPSPSMFASVLDVVARSKVKFVASTLIVGSLIGVTNAKVQALLPEAVRNLLPSFVIPRIELPRMEHVVPLPTFGQAAPAKQADAPAIAVAMPIDAGRVHANYVPMPRPTVAVAAVGSQQGVRVAPSPLAAPAVARVDAGLAGRPTPDALRAMAVNAGNAARSTAFTTGRSIGMLADPVAGGGSSGPSSAPEPAVSTASAEPAGTANWGGIIGGGGGGSGASPYVPIAPGSTGGDAADSASARLIAPVVGVVPSLNSRANTVSASTAAKAGNVDGTKSTQALDSTANASGKTTTAVFAGVSANYGGYSDDSWKTTSLVDMTGVIAEKPTYDYTGPAVPGTGLSVNGARVTLRGSTGTAAPTIAFVEPTQAGALPALPTGHHFIGAWSLTTDGTFASADILVRYDDLRAARLGLDEQVLKLWVSDGVNGWQLLWHDPTFGRDINQNLIWVTAAGGFKYFAVSAPEPTLATLIVGSAALLAGRRRRR